MSAERLLRGLSRLSVLDVAVGLLHGRFGSLADICSAKGHVRFAPNSDRESGLPQTVMSALPPKADMCGANGDVRFGPIADIGAGEDCANALAYLSANQQKAIAPTSGSGARQIRNLKGAKARGRGRNVGLRRSKRRKP
jgi:hypothetical protein